MQKNSNFKIFESALYMKSRSMLLILVQHLTDLVKIILKNWQSKSGKISNLYVEVLHFGSIWECPDLLKCNWRLKMLAPFEDIKMCWFGTLLKLNISKCADFELFQNWIHQNVLIWNSLKFEYIKCADLDPGIWNSLKIEYIKTS